MVLNHLIQIGIMVNQIIRDLMNTTQCFMKNTLMELGTTVLVSLTVIACSFVSGTILALSHPAYAVTI